MRARKVSFRKKRGKHQEPRKIYLLHNFLIIFSEGNPENMREEGIIIAKIDVNQ